MRLFCKWIPAFAGMTMMIASAALAAPYSVDYAKSTLHFSGTHAGNAFAGTFTKWNAQIEFDAAHLDKSSVNVTIETASAKTGNMMYDGTLPSKDWFDAKDFPKATFVSNNISKNADGSYQANGTLTIRNTSLPMSFSFKLTHNDFSTPQVTSTARFAIDRISYNIGLESDAKAEWVSRDIGFEFTLVANKQL